MVEIKTENDLQNAFSNLNKTARFEYCFNCKGKHCTVIEKS